MIRDDPIYLAKYARDNDLMDKPWWKKLPRYIQSTKKTNRLLKDAKTNQRRNKLHIKFGMNISRDHNEKIMFYAYNGNTNFKDADILELRKSTASTP